MTGFTDLARPPLRASALTRALVVPGGVWSAVEVRERTVSTQDDVVAAARAGAPSGLVVVAEEQSGGRGRLDRAWSSPPRAGLTLSVLLRPVGVPHARWAWLPLLAGVALTRAVRRVARAEARLKWPNDLLLDVSGDAAGGKAAGVLAEVAGDAVVVGIGLNVTTARAELPGPEATSLLLAGAASTDRDTLLRAVLRELAGDYQVWAAHAGAADASGLRAAYVESCATLGRSVLVTRPGREPLVGEAVDVDADGRLVVDTADGPTPVAAGDVTHLRLAPPPPSG